MTTGQFVAFLGVSALVIVTPGPDTALTIRNALCGGGRRGGVATAAGVASGQATWALFTAGGVATLLRASQPAFLAVRLAGAGYLVYLGMRTLVGALRARRPAHASAGGRGARVSLAAAYRQGLFSNLGNPKMMVFFLSLLPQFTGAHASFGALLPPGSIFCAMTFVWLSGYAAVVARVGDFLRRARIRRIVDGFTGTVLVALGLRLVSEHR